MQQPIRSIGIILDGNRRWAKARGLPPFEGHRAGYEALKKLAGAASKLKEKYGLEYVTLYCFSTENWKRAEEEVGYLMKLFEEALSYVLNDVLRKSEKDAKNGIRLKIVGQRERFSETLQKLMKEAEERTAHFGGMTAVFALSYGGRAEIVQAAQTLQKENKEITEENLAHFLWGRGVPDPDIIIRTGGEQRLSNFLTWQSVYSELFFPEVMWPDFTVEDLEKIFEEYYARERRLGK